MNLQDRRALLIAYDICDPKRLNRVRRLLLGFGDPMQLSVFYCELTPKEMVDFRTRAADLINAREDQIAIADLGPAGKESIKTIGRGRETTERRAIVV